MIYFIVGSTPTTLIMFIWLKFYCLLFLSIFFFFDEEPFFDLTDWNIIHIFFFITCIIIIIYENLFKSKYGQFLFKDQLLLFSTFSYFFFFQNYIFLIIIFFCMHCLTPLEIELFELIDYYNSLFSWCSYSLFPCLILMFVVSFLTITLNTFISWSNKKYIIIVGFFIFLVLLINLIALLWDFFFSSMTSNLFWSNFKQFYIQSKSSSTYDNSLFVFDQFDWHREKTNFFMIKFEDLYLFFIKIFSLVSLFSLVCIWFFLLNEILLNYKTNKEVSYIFIAVCFRWIDNFIYIYFINYLLLFILGLRVSLKILIELWDYSFII